MLMSGSVSCERNALTPTTTFSPDSIARIPSTRACAISASSQPERTASTIPPCSATRSISRTISASISSVRRSTK